MCYNRIICKVQSTYTVKMLSKGSINLIKAVLKIGIKKGFKKHQKWKFMGIFYNFLIHSCRTVSNLLTVSNLWKLSVKSAMNRKKSQKNLLPWCVYILIFKVHSIMMMTLYKVLRISSCWLVIHLLSSPVLSPVDSKDGKGINPEKSFNKTKSNISILDQEIYSQF